MYLLFGFLAAFRLYLRFRGKRLSSTLLRVCHKNGNFVLSLYFSLGPSIKGQGRMADDSPKSVVNGFLRHLPPWPRKALNNSVIGMEQAYRQGKGLPLLSATHLIRACDQLQNRLSRGIRSGSGHQVATEISHLGGPHTRFMIYARCTHLGCTPDWKPSENKFKCPCQGSGYDSEEVNFADPAPRPMDRAHIERSPDGQILVDVSRLYQWPKGQPSQFNDDGAYLSS